MIILNKDKPQKNEYKILDDFKKSTSENEKIILTKKFVDRKETII